MTKETAFQTLGISEDASPQEIKQAWRDMLSVWHPDKHMGNERLRRKAEEQAKRINEAYDRIQTGNFKSSSRPQSESPPYEDFQQTRRQAYEYYTRREESKAREREESPPKWEKEKVKQKKTSGWTVFFWVWICFMLLRGLFGLSSNDEYDKGMPPHDIVHPKPQHALPKSTETLKERIARWGLQIPPEIYDRLQKFEEHSINVISAMDDILDAFKSASDDDAKQDALVAARVTIASFIPSGETRYEALYSYNEVELKQWVRATKRHHENYLKTGIRKHAEALLEEYEKNQTYSNNVISAMDDILDDFESASSDDDKQDALVSARHTIASFFPNNSEIIEQLDSQNEAQLKHYARRTKQLHANYLKTGIRKEAEALLNEQREKQRARVEGAMPILTKEEIEAALARAREEIRLEEEAARLHPIPPSPEELAAQELAYQQRQEAERAAERAAPPKRNYKRKNRTETKQ